MQEEEKQQSVKKEVLHLSSLLKTQIQSKIENLNAKIEAHPDDDDETLASKKLAAETFKKLHDARRTLDEHEEEER